MLGIRGKVGDLLFYRRDGKDYVKRIGKRNKAECSEEQWRHRMRFRTAVKFASRLPEEVKAVVKKHLDIAGPKGGLFVAPTHLLEPEVPWENIRAYMEACSEYHPAG